MSLGLHFSLGCDACKFTQVLTYATAKQVVPWIAQELGRTDEAQTSFSEEVVGAQLPLGLQIRLMIVVASATGDLLALSDVGP